MKITFKSENGYCPSCKAFGRIFFIQDRYTGSGYEYSLMSRYEKRKDIIRFKNAKEMMSHFIGEDISDDISVNLLLSYKTITRAGKYRMLEFDGIEYVWNEETNEIREYEEPEQLSGWFDSYFECINMAKEILKKKESEETGTQLSLFD